MLSADVRVVCLSLCLCAIGGRAADPVEQLAEDYFARRATRAISSNISMAEALRIQDRFVDQLVPKLGRPVGYKVGLVTKEAQEKSGVSGPIRGVLLEKMMLRDHAEVAVDFGAKPLVEADLVVVVGNRDINNAATHLDV